MLQSTNKIDLEIKKGEIKINMTKKCLERAPSPESLGISSESILNFIEDCESSKIELHSFMILRHGKVAAEAWWKPFNSETAHTMYSHSKSIASLAMGYAISEGLVSLETKVYPLFEDKLPRVIPREGMELNIRHLLTMTSGKLMNPMVNTEKMDWIKNFLAAPFAWKPGTKFVYTNENSYMLCAIVNKVTGMSVTDYLMPRLFEPLGIDRPFWEADQNGIEAGGWGLQLKTEDQAKIIQCCLQNGMWEGKQVIPADYLAEATSYQVDNAPGKPDNRVGYGFQFWMNRLPNSYRCDGLFSQFSIAMKDYDCCIVTNAGAPDEQGTLNAIWRHFPTGFSDEPLPENPEALKKLKDKIASLSMPLMEVMPRNPQMEEKLRGKSIHTRDTGFASILAAPATFMLSKKPGNIDNIRFEFSLSSTSMTFKEKNSPENTIEIGLDGKVRMSKIQLANLHLDIAAQGAWRSDGSFEVWIRPLQMTQIRKMRFVFGERGAVIIHSRAEQPLYDLAVFWMGFIGLNVTSPLKAAAKGVVSSALPVIDPDIFGLLRPSK